MVGGDCVLLGYPTIVNRPNRVKNESMAVEAGTAV